MAIPLNYLLNSRGILGINARNQHYIRPSGFKRALRIIDNKLPTKRIMKKAGIPTPETLGVIKSMRDLYRFAWGSLPPSFILKPNRGYTGRGIIIVYGKKKNERFAWVKADRSVLRIRDLQTHIHSILEGDYGKSGLSDIAYFEERLKIAKVFKPYSSRGIPDIRIIMYNKIPVMAQLRLPTSHSEGKANLHLGAIGVGVDMATGITTNAILNNTFIEYIPGTRLSPRGIKIPNWSQILSLAYQSQVATRVNFLGVDIAIDREKGPMVLELNTRPGLAVQVANLAPLGERLERVRGLKVGNAKRAVNIAQDLFGGETEEEVEEVGGKKIIGANELVEIIAGENKKIETIAKIDTGAYRSVVAKTIADAIGLDKIERYKRVRSSLGEEERPIVKAVLKIHGVAIETEVFIADRNEMKKDVIIGRKDLKQFVVDPTKNILIKKT